MILHSVLARPPPPNENKSGTHDGYELRTRGPCSSSMAREAYILPPQPFKKKKKKAKTKYGQGSQWRISFYYFSSSSQPVRRPFCTRLSQQSIMPSTNTHVHTKKNDVHLLHRLHESVQLRGLISTHKKKGKYPRLSLDGHACIHHTAVPNNRFVKSFFFYPPPLAKQHGPTAYTRHHHQQQQQQSNTRVPMSLKQNSIPCQDKKTRPKLA